MTKSISKHRVRKALCLFTLSQAAILLVLNLIPIGGKWATECRGRIEKIISLT